MGPRGTCTISGSHADDDSASLHLAADAMRRMNEGEISSLLLVFIRSVCNSQSIPRHFLECHDGRRFSSRFYASARVAVSAVVAAVCAVVDVAAISVAIIAVVNTNPKKMYSRHFK